MKASPVTGPRGFDGAKKVDGIKRHILVDTTGTLVGAIVTTADVQDRAAFPALLRRAKRIAPALAHVWADKGCTGGTVVERTNGWINHCRRIDRQYEVTLIAHEGFAHLSQIALLLRRLDRSRLFDTL